MRTTPLVPRSATDLGEQFTPTEGGRRRRRMGSPWWATMGLLAVVMGAPAAHGQDLEGLAEKLIELRGQVEALNDEIDSKQQGHRNEMSSLSQRKAELDALISRQELEIKKVENSLEELRVEATGVSSQVAALTPMVENGAKSLRKTVGDSLPYQTSGRTTELEAIVKRLESEEITAARAMNQLWTFVEDELRLSRESGLFRQTIQLDDSEQLADVIRLGMVMLFFRTGDDRYGYAERSGAGWTYTVVSGGDAALLEDLFSNFERSVRTGFFEIPNALPGEG